MDKRNEIIETLNDLVRINNDRIEGYKSAIRELDVDDEDLKSLFDRMIAQSMLIKSDLSQEIEVLRGEMDGGTTAQGKIYRTWLGLKAVFTGHDRHAVLQNCESEEDATQKAYDAALESHVIPDFIREMLEHQQEILLESHNKIRALRDVHA